MVEEVTRQGQVAAVVVLELRQQLQPKESSVGSPTFHHRSQILERSQQ